MESQLALDTEKLANLVRTKRGSRGLRETALIIGDVSPSAISRVENSKTPNLDTFLALCDWLEVSPAEVIKNTEDSEVIVGRQPTDAEDEVAVGFHADKDLDSAIAVALASLIEAAKKTLPQNEIPIIYPLLKLSGGSLVVAEVPKAGFRSACRLNTPQPGDVVLGGLAKEHLNPQSGDLILSPRHHFD